MYFPSKHTHQTDESINQQKHTKQNVKNPDKTKWKNKPTHQLMLWDSLLIISLLLVMLIL